MQKNTLKDEQRCYFCIRTSDLRIWSCWKETEVSEKEVLKFCKKMNFVYSRVTRKFVASWKKTESCKKYQSLFNEGNRDSWYLDQIYHLETQNQFKIDRGFL